MIRLGMSIAATLVVIAAWAARVPAHDPDACHKAKQWSDIMVCGNPNLAALDSTVDNAYQTAQQSLSPKDAEEVREVQAAWLRGREKCQEDSDPTKCLENYYQRRIKDIVQPKDNPGD